MKMKSLLLLPYFSGSSVFRNDDSSKPKNDLAQQADGSGKSTLREDHGEAMFVSCIW